MAKTNHVLTVLIIIVSMLLIGHVIETYMSNSHLVSNYFEVATQLLPLVLAFSIFAINWFAYNKSRDNHSLFLGATFLVIGIFDLFNMLSYPYMPDFVTPNSSMKAEIFWAEARVISAILFLASVYIYKDAFPKMINKPVIFTCAVALPIISMALVFLYPSYLPRMHDQDGGLSTAGIMILLVSGSLIIYTIYQYIIKFQKTGQASNVCLIYGLVIIVFSNSVYLFYDYTGHLLKAAGFYFIYFGLFKSSIQQPYEKMADTEHKLRYVAEERYRNLFDNANDAIIITDLKDVITSWNRSAETIFGWTSEEVIGKSLSPLIVPPRYTSERQRIIGNVLSGGAVAGFDTVRLRKDGNRINVSMTISPIRDSEENIIRLSSIIRDITERKKAEEALQESEDRYRRLVEMSPDAIAIHSAGKIIFINASGARLLGAHDPGQLLGRSIMDFIYPDHLEIAEKRYRMIIDDGNEVPLKEVKFIKMDGTVIDVEEVAIPFTYQGKPAIQMVIHNITERKKADEQIRSSLAEKEVLLREIHHRVKNNMQIISSLLSLQSECTKDNNVIEMFKESRNRIISMSLIHEKLYQSHNFSNIDLRGYINDLVSGLYQSYGTNAGKIRPIIDVENVSLAIDSAIPCGLIINELVSNSLKYAFPEDRKGEIKIVLRSSDDNCIELIVSDTGIGIPKDLELKDVRSLGLHMVTILAENQLHGKMNLTRDNGTEFQIKFRGVN